MADPSGGPVSKVDFLRRLPYFAELSDEDVNRLCGRAPELVVRAGEVLIAEGTPPDAMFIVLDGELEVLHRQDRTEVHLGRVVRGDPVGEMSLLEDQPRNATVRAVVDSHVVRVERSAFEELLGNPASVLAMLRTVIARLRATEAAVRQQEKLAALGTLTAGLMHELNNPAAAVRRGAVTLADHVRAIVDGARAAVAAGVDDVADFVGTAGEPPARDLDRADRVEEIAAWLDGWGVEDAWEVAPELVAAGWDRSGLEARLAEAGEHAGALARWVAHVLAADRIAGEIGTAADRISDIVRAAKGYVYEGRGADLQEVDLHAGIRDTLTILGHELREVEVVLDLDPGDPVVEARGGELNQVWTNLVVNAIDAMEGHGRLSIRTRRKGDQVSVEIADSGPGIPEEHRGHVFDLFFTTKPQGEGTGFGLHTVAETVRRHGGTVFLDTRPGETTFRVTLPTRQSPAA